MHKADPQAVNAQTRVEDRYDTRDLKIAGLWKHVVGIFGFAVLMIVVCVALYDFVIPKIYPDGGLTRARNMEPILPEAPNPMVQTGHQAMMDIVELKRAEQEHTTSYGWVDKQKGIARIPVERAIEETAKQGLAPSTEGAQR